MTLLGFFVIQVAGWIILISGADKLSSPAERHKLERHLATLHLPLPKSSASIFAAFEAFLGAWLIVGIAPTISPVIASCFFGAMLLGITLLARHGIQECGCGGVLRESRIDAQHLALLVGLILGLALVSLARQSAVMGDGPGVAVELANGQLGLVDVMQLVIIPALLLALFVRRFLRIHGPSILAVAREKVGEDFVRPPSQA